MKKEAIKNMLNDNWKIVEELIKEKKLKHLKSANFEGANLKYANLKNAWLDEAELEGAILPKNYKAKCKQIPVYMYLPTTIQEQKKKSKGNAIYYTKSAVKQNIEMIKQRNQEAIDMINDQIATLEPLIELGGDIANDIKILRKELDKINTPKLSDYKMLYIDFSDVKEL